MERGKKKSCGVDEEGGWERRGGGERGEKRTQNSQPTQVRS